MPDMTEDHPAQAPNTPALPDSFELRFDWTQADELASLSLASRTVFNPAAQMRLLIASTAGAALMMMGYHLGIAGRGLAETLLDPFVLGLIILTMILTIHAISKGRKLGDSAPMMQKVIERKGGMPAGLTGSFTLVVDQTGLRNLLPGMSECHIRWPAIDQITVAEGYILLHNLWLVWARIPDNAFTSPGEREAFLQACAAWKDAAA